MKTDDGYFDDQFVNKLFQVNSSPEITDLLKAIALGSATLKTHIYMLNTYLYIYKDQLLKKQQEYLNDPDFKNKLNVYTCYQDYLDHMKKIGHNDYLNESDYFKVYQNKDFQTLFFPNFQKGKYERRIKQLQLYIDSMENEKKLLELIFTGSEDQQEATPETATQPKKNKRRTERKLTKKKKINILEQLRLSIIDRKENENVRNENNYHRDNDNSKLVLKKTYGKVNIGEIDDMLNALKQKSKTKKSEL